MRKQRIALIVKYIEIHVWLLIWWLIVGDAYLVWCGQLYWLYRVRSGPVSPLLKFTRKIKTDWKRVRI